MKSSMKLSEYINPEIIEELKKTFVNSENEGDFVDKVLYHGTSQIYADDLTDIAKINPLLNENLPKDFAAGFYLTSSSFQAYQQGINKQPFIKRKLEIESKINPELSNEGHKPLVIAYDMDIERLNSYFNKHPEKKYLIFNENQIDDEWYEFILNNRLGKKNTNIWRGELNNLKQEFSIVQGPLADGKIGALIAEYQYIPNEEREQFFNVFKKEISKNFKFGKGNQISIHDKELIQEVLTFKEIVNNDKIKREH